MPLTDAQQLLLRLLKVCTNNASARLVQKDGFGQCHEVTTKLLGSVCLEDNNTLQTLVSPVHSYLHDCVKRKSEGGKAHTSKQNLCDLTALVEHLEGQQTIADWSGK